MFFSNSRGEPRARLREQVPKSLIFFLRGRRTTWSSVQGVRRWLPSWQMSCHIQTTHSLARQRWPSHTTLPLTVAGEEHACGCRLSSTNSTAPASALLLSHTSSMHFHRADSVGPSGALRRHARCAVLPICRPTVSVKKPENPECSTYYLRAVEH